MITYCVLKESFEDETLGSYSSFGIAAFNDENGIKEQIVYIPDAFTDSNRALLLADRCNTLSLDPIHLFDVICDSL